MPHIRFLLLVLVVAAGPLAAGPAPARAAELLMFESETCEWCARWHEEIGPAYGKTRYGRIAPLRRIDIDRTVPAAYRAVRGIWFDRQLDYVLAGNAPAVLEAHGGPEGVARRRRELAAAIEEARAEVGRGVAKTEELVLEEVPA